MQILFGLGAATLGILSLVGIFAPITLTLVATLAVGGASLFSGAVLSLLHLPRGNSFLEDALTKYRAGTILARTCSIW